MQSNESKLQYCLYDLFLFTEKIVFISDNLILMKLNYPYTAIIYIYMYTLYHMYLRRQCTSSRFFQMNLYCYDVQHIVINSLTGPVKS